MKKEEALELMRSAIDINDWNQKRDVVKNDADCGGQELINTVIDQNGMCVKTLHKGLPRRL